MHFLIEGLSFWEDLSDVVEALELHVERRVHYLLHKGLVMLEKYLKFI